MARIEEGMHGAFKGKVGKLVGGKWNGVDYIRSIGTRSNQPTTPRQEEHRSKLSLVVDFVRSIKSVVKISFREKAIKMSGYNAAVKQILKTAVTGNSPDYRIDYTQVMVSRGERDGLLRASVASTVAETITFKWNYGYASNLNKPTDKAILVAHCETHKVSVFTIQGPDRSTGTGSLEMPGFSGQKVHAWVAFISADGVTVYDSSYAGEVMIT
ncbi:hypothetical protein FAM09_01520 [Niastella caeni]|uniref:Uncharacterized protein n=1 Tax=Niastella caeni TaxID=2569763 RepID=A0A4S8I0V7_9BACT|nr:DUF6266 family protein [Niastella caeni]THU40819.1 hypothetical protein FAM09_01520 [Niastella caeni]